MANCEWSSGMRLGQQRKRVAKRSTKVCSRTHSWQCKSHSPFAEFLDLWHELKVPNEVDLQRELANGKLLATLGKPLLRFLQRVSRSLLQKRRPQRAPPIQRRRESAVVGPARDKSALRTLIWERMSTFRKTMLPPANRCHSRLFCRSAAHCL